MAYIVLSVITAIGITGIVSGISTGNGVTIFGGALAMVGGGGGLIVKAMIDD